MRSHVSRFFVVARRSHVRHETLLAGAEFFEVRASLYETFLVRAACAVRPITLIMVLGHSTIQMTERYAHLSPDHLIGKTDFLELAPTPEAKVLNIRQGGC